MTFFSRRSFLPRAVLPERDLLSVAGFPYKNHLSRVVFFLVALTLLIFSCTSKEAKKVIPRAKKGVLDLSAWSFKNNVPVALNGEWEFYWKTDMSPGNVATVYSPREIEYISVPGIWNGFPSDGGPISGKGFATYRMKLLVNPQEAVLALRFIDIATAFTAYVNGQRILSVGVPAQSAATTIPRFHPQVVNLPLLSPEIDFIIFVSNFDHYKGGLWEEIVLGDSEQVRKLRERDLAFSLFFFGAILVMGLYHLGLFLNHKSDRSSLYYGLFCLVICVRILTTGERYLIQIFPDFPWAVLMKLSYLSFYTAVPLFAFYAKSIFSQEVEDKILFSILLVGGAFSVFILFAPAFLYTNTVQLYQGFTILVFLYGFYVILRARSRKRQGALIFLLGYGILFLTGVNDILYSNLIIVTTYLLPLGLFFFMFSQVLLLSKRFGKAFQTIETQKEELFTTNAAYRNEIQERKRAQELLGQSNADLEIRVQERTSALANLNQKLMSEIEERRRSEQALRGSERQRRVLSFQILTAQENERKVIAQDLHDGIASNLAAIKFKLAQVESREAEVQGDFSGALDLLQQTIDDLRRIMRNLRPAILDDLGILATIRWFVDEFRKIYPHIRIHEEMSLQEGDVPERLKIEIFRILQEATRNTVKHSGASEIRISLISDGGQLELSVEDNGEGFKAQGIHRGLGLNSMRERVELSGGSFTLETAEGQGTKIIARWPRENSQGT